MQYRQLKAHYYYINGLLINMNDILRFIIYSPNIYIYIFKMHSNSKRNDAYNQFVLLVSHCLNNKYKLHLKLCMYIKYNLNYFICSIKIYKLH